MSADKTKTIKGSTDKELEELLIRLKKEGELQRLIADLKRNASPTGMMAYDAPNVSTETPIEDLYHVGIMGMHWGVRRASGGSSKPKTPTSDDHKAVRELTKKGLSKLSTADLKKINERMQSENTFKNLNPSKMKKADNFIKKVLAVGATVAAVHTFVTSPFGQAVIKTVKSKVVKTVVMPAIKINLDMP